MGNFDLVTFGRVKVPCEDCVNGNCTMNCSGAELVSESEHCHISPDKGFISILRDVGMITVRVRSPGETRESKTMLPFDVWEQIAIPPCYGVGQAGDFPAPLPTTADAIIADLRNALAIVKAERDHWHALVPRADRVQFPFSVQSR